ncbi:Hypothetical predicted protein [Mytilus galloprovincialis]|uniref:Tyr recombinase domain-containing protein n=1 Tax=Mytilus galloprovincialis TaxID=29158 RepID=A0A8B6DMD1_MYTGA|nr:Hypothetical predicted protein [Mytilus galloprovincialis]
MKQQGSQVLFELPKLTKTCRPGSKTKSIAFESFPNEKSLCVVTCINDYMSRTESWREQGDNIDRSWLLLSVVKPHHHIVPSSVARWLKETIKKSGFSSLFTGHSTRSASTSKAKRVGLSTQDVIDQAKWTNESTFMRFYCKPIWEVEPGTIPSSPRSSYRDQERLMTRTRIIKINDIKCFFFETDTEKSIALVKGLENNVNRNKGKGIKSRSCIKVVKNVQKIDSIPIKHLETEEGEAPYVVVFLDQEGNTLCSHVIGHGRKIIEQTLNVLDSLLLLIAVYYVFDLDYPEIYSQTLGILQQWAIGDQYTQQKSSNWIKFYDVLSRNKNE